MMPNWTNSQLSKQFSRAKDLGWLPAIQSAATTYGLTSAVLLAIASRETGLDPKYLRVSGDKNRGFGLWQADIGSYPVWIKSGAWKDVQMSSMFAAKVLTDKLNEIKKFAERSKVGLDDKQALRLAIAAYNHGSKGVFADFKRGLDPDKGTTGHDYSKDTLNREEVFLELLSAMPEKKTEEVITAVPVVALEAPKLDIPKPEDLVVTTPPIPRPEGWKTWSSTITGVWANLGISATSIGSVLSGAVKDPMMIKIMIGLGILTITGAVIFALVYLTIRTIHILADKKYANELQLKEMDLKADPSKYNVTAGK